MNYETRKLKDVTLIRTGKLNSNAATINGEYPFFTCDPTTLRTNTYSFDTEAILLAGNNANGNYTAKYYCGKFDVYQRTYVIQSIDSNILNVRYLGYIMSCKLRDLKVMSSGSTTKFLTIGMLHNLEIPLPDIQIQCRSANTLSAYDDLIENNLKQIKLLEEAAMRLYKEWFVKLRFPGYETTKIIDGVPEGWKKGEFEELCVLIKDTVKPKDIPINMPYIGLEHMPRKSLCLNEWINADGVNSNKFKFIKDDILFGKIRPYFHKIGFALIDGVSSTDSIVFRANENMFGLLLMTAFSDPFVKYTSTTCKEGSKMPRADWNEMKQYSVLIPELKILIDFNQRIFDYTRLMRVLSLQILSLRQSRDKLLPKLMSGEIEV